MINPDVERELNRQLNSELYSSHLYLSASTYCAKNNFVCFAKWLKDRSNEERDHAFKIRDEILEREGSVVIEDIKKPTADWPSLFDVIKNVENHEKEVTEKINQLYDLALSKKDHASSVFLQWFVTEQVEEVSSVQKIINHLKVVDNDLAALYQLDRHLTKILES